MPEIKEAFGFGNAICANGAMHYDLLNEKVIEEWLIPIDSQFEFVKRMRSAVPSISFATEYGNEFHHESAYVPHPIVERKRSHDEIHCHIQWRKRLKALRFASF